MKHIKGDIQINEAKTLIIRGNLINITNKRTFGIEISVLNGHIGKVTPTRQDEEYYLLPGLIDVYVYIGSSTVTPAMFIHAAIRHGGIGAVANPHEIANVVGIEEVEYILDNMKEIPLYTWLGVPFYVPATAMETSGAVVDTDGIARLLGREDLHFLAEMMNYPEVLNKDPEIMRKIGTAGQTGKSIDGHYPLATGPKLKTYIESGISTDHETICPEKGRERCEPGVHVLVREGSMARDFDALHPLLKEYPEQIMFCTDGAHPSFLNRGRIDRMVKKSLDLGYNLYDVLQAASYNPAMHYKIPAGFLQEGDSANFIQVNNLKDLTIQAAYTQGTYVYDGEKCTLSLQKPMHRNNFYTKPITLEKLAVEAKGEQMRVTVCKDNELTTKEELHPVYTFDGFVESDTEQDILKLVVLDRYRTAPPAITFIKGAGLKFDAIAQNISHDSHSIIAIGIIDFELTQAIGVVIKAKKGIATSCTDGVTPLFPPVAGLMSDESLEETSHCYEEIEEKIKRLKSPIDLLQMILSFMGLLAVPPLRLSNKGLFNNETFQFISLFV